MNKSEIKKDRSGLYAFLIRWWCAGAVFFLVGWGTQVGSYARVGQLIILLGIVLGIFNSLIVNPALKMLYNIGNQKPYLEMTMKQRLILRFKDVGFSILICWVIGLIYQAINVCAIFILNLSEQSVFLPAEPILFGLVYSSLFLLFVKLYMTIKRKVK